MDLHSDNHPPDNRTYRHPLPKTVVMGEVDKQHPRSIIIILVLVGDATQHSCSSCAYVRSRLGNSRSELVQILFDSNWIHWCATLSVMLAFKCR